MHKLLPSTRLKSMSVHFDLAHSIRSLMQQTPVQWNFHHVKGHQDTTNSANLDLWAKLNIKCDYEAGICRQLAHWKKIDPTFLPLFNPIWRIVINGVPVIGNLRKKILFTVHCPNIFQYWKKHKVLTLCPLEVNWEALGTAASTSTISRKLWTVKNATD